MSNPWSQSYEELRKSIDEASSSYLEKDMKKRAKNNEKARKDMEKMGGMKNPHFGKGPSGSMSSEAAEGMHRDAKTGEVVKKAEVGKTYYPNMPKKKTSVALRKEKMKEAIDPKGAARIGTAKGKKNETQDQIDKRLMLGKYSPAAKYGKVKKEGLDPVGQEDKDIDNDGDHDKSDKYLAKRRKAIGKAMKHQKEDWRSSLGFLDEAGCSGDDMEDKKDMKKIGKGKVNNKIEVMPNVKIGKQNEEVDSNTTRVTRNKNKSVASSPTSNHYNGVKEDKDPCWDTHKQVGMKKKGGKMVPNCVPKGKNEELYVDGDLIELPIEDRDDPAAVAAARDAARAKAEAETNEQYGSAYHSALQVQQPEKNPPKRQQKMSQAAAQYAKSKKKPGFKDFPTEELDYYLKGDFNPAAHAANAVKKMAREASWDMKTGKAKDPKQRAKDAQKAMDMKARDKRAGRRTYGSAKLGYAKKDWDE